MKSEAIVAIGVRLRFCCNWVVVGFLLLVTSVSSAWAIETINYYHTPVKFLTHSVGDRAVVIKNGHIQGKANAGRRAFFVEMVNEMMREVGPLQPVNLVSLSRGLHLLEQDNYALFSVRRTQSRENKYKWVGPIHVFSVWFYEAKSQPARITTLAEAKGVNAICVVRGNNSIEFLSSIGFKNLLETPSNSNCADLLLYGRVALLTGSEYPWFATHPDYSSAILRTGVKITENASYIAFSKNIDDEVIAYWQQALDRVKKSDKYRRIIDDFLLPKER